MADKSDKIKDLEKRMTEAGTPEETTEVLIDGVADALDGLTHDPVAIKALAKELRDHREALKAASAKPHSHHAKPKK